MAQITGGSDKRSEHIGFDFIGPGACSNHADQRRLAANIPRGDEICPSEGASTSCPTLHAQLDSSRASIRVLNFVASDDIDPDTE
ncbi:hypothetical protein [Burkholderia alba]|uniref:hypothetical protein n=1 Tax=Burkholderia alba TaxID=2683677 RepID=UPI002B054FDB|nr:hypothetical protein [Burkholderia alba]